MAGPPRDRFRRGFLLALVIGITVSYLAMIRGFLMPLVVAGLLASALHGLHERVATAWGGRRALASAATVAGVVVVIAIPVVLLVGLVVTQAVTLTRAAEVWVAQHDDGTGLDLRELDAMLPAIGGYQPRLQDLVDKAGELTAAVGGLVASRLAHVGALTAAFVLDAFIAFYALFFYLLYGPRWLQRLLHMLPLTDDETRRLVDRIRSISGATIRGTLVIGAVQGAIAGVAFALAGVPAAVFWGSLMAVLSIIPGVGASLVWIPASLYLMLTGSVVSGVVLFTFCAGVVGTVDNLLRPRLVGQDAGLDDLTILVSTLGGLTMFGPLGLVLGPILAGVWVVVMDLYGAEFASSLVRTAPDEDPDAT